MRHLEELMRDPFFKTVTLTISCGPLGVFTGRLMMDEQNVISCSFTNLGKLLNEMEGRARNIIEGEE